ncbi:MAG: aspartate kinase [Nitrososphaerota archaeon]|nr:aspartate kinase [Candidatus Bathyarchaeota archaeon]MDW8022287.1 aspartate kinase [Nitrososphaerota archaeon]
MAQIDFGCKKIVVKFGGSSLADSARIHMAVRAVAREAAKGTRVAVVVSAMGKTTDHLLNTVKNAAGGNIEKKELDEILAMGERTSVRIFAAALKANGVESRYFDPSDPDWPIITDDAFSNANPILEECAERIWQHVFPLFEKGLVPVIAGFVGRTVDGKITTLGRGGSDTTAFILAKALNADEVILVTDADGIMTADPKLVKNPQRIREIDVGTLVGLADSGVKFIHRKALKYKDPSINVRVIAYTHGDLNQEGTSITGALPKELDVSIASAVPVASIAVVGQGISNKPIIVKELIEEIKAHSALLGLSLDHNSMVSFVTEDGSELDLLLNKIHEIVLRYREAIAMSVRRNLAFLRISGVGFEETPGLIGKISEPLRLNDMNIFGILTNTSSVLVFVNWEEKEKALSLIRSSFGLKGGE